MATNLITTNCQVKFTTSMSFSSTCVIIITAALRRTSFQVAFGNVATLFL